MKKIRVFVVNLSKKNVLIRKFVRKSYILLKKLKYLRYKLFYKMDDKVIFFEAFGGRNYTCSPKAIYEKILTMKEFKDFKFVWAFVDPSKHDVLNDKRLTIVKTNSKDYYKADNTIVLGESDADKVGIYNDLKRKFEERAQEKNQEDMEIE